MGAKAYIESMVNLVGSLLLLFVVFFPPAIAFVRMILNLGQLSKCKKEDGDKDNKYKRNNCIANLIIDVLIIAAYLLGYAIIMRSISNGIAHM